MTRLTEIVYNIFIFASRAVFREANSGSISSNSTGYRVWLTIIVYCWTLFLCWSNCTNFWFDRIRWTDDNIARLWSDFNTGTSYASISFFTGNFWTSSIWDTLSIDAMVAYSACVPTWSPQAFSINVCTLLDKGLVQIRIRLISTQKLT